MINESYLDPDIHLWPDCPDDVCFHCGFKFPADWEIEENTPQWDGFCSEDCHNDNAIKKRIPCVRPMFDLLSVELCRDDVSGWEKSVFKGTDCGAWINLVDSNTIQLGSIVEGSDGDCETFTLEWPFTCDDFWHCLDQIESEAKYIFERDNAIYFKAVFTPPNKPIETYFACKYSDSIIWHSQNVPNYVQNKTSDFFKNNGQLTSKGISPCLSLKLSEC